MEPSPMLKEAIAESVLWTTWRHQGRLRATIQEVELICVNPEKFVDVMSIHPKPWTFAKQYATIFLEFLNSVDKSDLSDIIRNDTFFEDAIEEVEQQFQRALVQSCGLSVCTEASVNG